MKGLIFLLFLTATCLQATAQRQAVKTAYAGQVIDSGGKAVEYATLILLHSERQQAGTVTDSAGGFHMEVPVGTYTLAVQCVGYEPLCELIKLPITGQSRIVLKPSAYALKEVVVQAKNIERKADRFIVSVSPSTGKDGTELLSQAPGVWLSEDNISINGAAGTKVFIDNREIKLKGEELLSYLRSLKSENIRQIEVIPLAGVEYDASSGGGIIHILLRQRQDNGMQGSLMLGTTLSSSLNRYLPSGTLNARIGKWTLNTGLSGTFTPKNDGEMTAIRLYPDQTTHFSSLSGFDRNTNYGTGRIGAILDIDTLNSIGGEIEYIRQAAENNSSSRTVLSKAGMPVNSYGDYSERNNYNTFTATANYLHKFDNQGSLLKLIVDYANKRSDGRNAYRVMRETAGWKDDSTYRSHADATYDIITSNLSFTKQIKSSMSVNAGMKYTHTYMNDKSGYEGLSEDENWIVNPAYGYTLRYRENITGAYASFSAAIGRWSLKGGFRGEYTQTSNRNDMISRNYFDLFPNLNITYAFNQLKTHMVVGQYARNIERPAFYALSPNHIQLSDYSYQIGNPYLKPTYIDRFNLTYVYNYRYTITIGGNLHHNLIREFGKIDINNPDISYITYENHARENHWFVAVSVPFQPASWCNLSANLVGIKQDIKMTDASAFAKHYLLFANAIATFYLPAGYSTEIQYSGASRLYSGNSEVAPRHTLDLTVRKKFINDRLLVTAGVGNLFNRHNDYANDLESYRNEVRYTQGSTGRVFKVSLSWSFNSGKKVGKSKIEKSGENEFGRLNEK